MEEDSLTFKKLFSSLDKNETGQITREDLDSALEDKLFIESSPVLNLVYKYLEEGKN